MNVLVKEGHLFFNAWVNFTRLPAPSWVIHSSEHLSAATRYLPLIGVIVGIIAAAIYQLTLLIFPLSIAVLFSIITTVWVTGAFHEDGFADVCDGFGGGWEKNQILAIMKDSRLGTYGLLGLGLLLTLKALLLIEMSWNLVPVIIAGHSVSRLFAVSLMYTHDYVQSDDISKVRSLVSKMCHRDFLISIAFGLAPLLFFGHVYVFLALIPMLLIREIMAGYFVKHIGGYTGDCLGAVQQITEVVFYCAVFFLWMFI